MAATTFVTCMFQYDEAMLDTWIQSGLQVVLYCPRRDYEKVLCLCLNTTTIQVKELPEISELEWYHHQSHNLPSVRNEKKDTMEHLWKMQMKVYCVYQAAVLLLSETTFFAYIDFDITRMFKHPAETMTSIRENYSMPHLFVSDPNKMYFPGCWAKTDVQIINADFANKINWRFCGSFFFGCRDAILQFYHYHTMYFPDFMESVGDTMTWEVNFWAYLEWKVEDWKPVWYAANHDDSIVRIPGLFGYKILLTDFPPEKTKTTVYDYPDMSPFRPMSAAYVKYLGESYLNTRYVNYWIYDNGGYYYPEDEGVIRTLNVCSVLEAAEPLDYQPMKNSPPADLNDDAKEGGRNTFFSEGIEDIRLYVSQETGELCFIGSTLSYSQKKDKIRTIRGVYDVVTHTCRDFQQLDPPTETWCEKNWAPIPLGGGLKAEDGFIYKWFPLEIGKVGPGGKLEIVVRKEMDSRFRHMKGSTSFTSFRDKTLIGVVHFSEEMHPRQYYHRVVVLDAETFDVVKCSDIFCFEKASVEFCIGCRVIDVDNKMGFWISRMDRDPMYMETEIECIMGGGKHPVK